MDGSLIRNFDKLVSFVRFIVSINVTFCVYVWSTMPEAVHNNGGGKIVDNN